ncbi:MAG: hypothetical protein DSZ06_01655 [Sulfurospirillum sp.]|nr:MAG: hypothetical protein DSZ06_01655 [Sulfurospirillum sp.]
MSIYDYITILWFVFVLFLLFILIILLAKKKPKLAIWLTFFSVVLIVVAPFGIKYFLDQSVRKVTVVKDKVVRLKYASTLIVTGFINNKGDVDFHTCQIDAKVIRYTPNPVKFKINSLKPIRFKSVVIDENLTVGDSLPFRVVFDNFKYQGEYNISLEGVCY